MSAGFSPLQREVIARLGFTLMTQRAAVPSQDALDAGGADVVADSAPASSSPMPAGAATSNAALPAWAQRALRFFDAACLTPDVLQALPPRPAEAKRALWQRLRKEARRAP